MAYIGLNDKVLKNEYCSNPKGQEFCSGICYHDYYQCPHWKQEWITLKELNNLQEVNSENEQKRSERV